MENKKLSRIYYSPKGFWKGLPASSIGDGGFSAISEKCTRISLPLCYFFFLRKNFIFPQNFSPPLYHFSILCARTSHPLCYFFILRKTTFSPKNSAFPCATFSFYGKLYFFPKNSALPYITFPFYGNRNGNNRPTSSPETIT